MPDWLVAFGAPWTWTAEARFLVVYTLAILAALLLPE